MNNLHTRKPPRLRIRKLCEQADVSSDNQKFSSFLKKFCVEILWLVRITSRSGGPDGSIRIDGSCLVVVDLGGVQKY